jgi:hypothetical protein
MAKFTVVGPNLRKGSARALISSVPPQSILHGADDSMGDFSSISPKKTACSPDLLILIFFCEFFVSIRKPGRICEPHALLY